MRRVFLLLCILAAVPAGISCCPEICDCPEQTGEGTGQDGGGGEDGKEEGPAAPEPEREPVFNIAAACYPEGYDWLRDPDYGIVGCSIRLFQDGKWILDFSAGHSYEVSADIGRVRCIGDHVYTDYARPSETVVGRDGTELFRYQGAETMAGFAESGDGSIYTLGIPENGGGAGWTFRKDGEIMASSASGRIIPGFRLDGGVPVFACAEQVEYVTGTSAEYYLVRDGRKSEILPGSPAEAFSAVMSVGGTVCALSSDSGSGKTYFYSGDDRMELTYSGSAEITPECLLTDGSSVYALAKASYGGTCRSVLWKDGAVLEAFDESFEVVACYPEGDRVLAAGYYGEDWDSQYMFLDGDYIPFPENYGLATVSSGCLKSGHYCLCLNPFESSKPPLYILDGEILEVEANGCFLGIGYTWK